MVLRRLQTLLGRLYDVELSHDVYDFLITDRRAIGASTNERRTLEEELLLAETTDGASAGVALYLDPELLSRLEAADPHRALPRGSGSRPALASRLRCRSRSRASSSPSTRPGYVPGGELMDCCRFVPMPRGAP